MAQKISRPLDCEKSAEGADHKAPVTYVALLIGVIAAFRGRAP